MAIQSSELQLLKALTKIGGDVSTFPAEGANNLFAVFSGAESAAGRTEYACVFVRNTSAQTAFNVEVYISSEDTHELVEASLGLGTSGVDIAETSTADEVTAPTGVTFVAADGVAESIAIGDLTAGQYKSLWVELVVPTGTTATDFNFQVTIAADTGA